MRHARDDYMRIQDPDGKIPKDEPVFLMRGQDIIGPKVLRFYAAKCANEDVAAMVLAWAFEMERWQAETHRVKVADL